MSEEEMEREGDRTRPFSIEHLVQLCSGRGHNNQTTKNEPHNGAGGRCGAGSAVAVVEEIQLKNPTINIFSPLSLRGLRDKL